MHKWLTFLLVIAFTVTANAAEVKIISWQTAHAAPAVELDEERDELLPLIRFGGFREYSRRPDSYLGYICLAAYPPNDVLASFPANGRIRLVAGGDEPFVKNSALQSAEQRLKRRVSDYASHLIPNQDHFFMLSAEEETKQLLRRWDSELRSDL